MAGCDVTAPPRASRVMRARKRSVCPLCHRIIEPGRQIGYSRVWSGWACVTCIIKLIREATAAGR